MNFRTVFLAILLSVATITMPMAVPAHASSRAHSTSSKSHKKNDRPKTVHVRSYKKKDGTVVKAHDRAAPRP
jgi:hypothetical protein